MNLLKIRKEQLRMLFLTFLISCFFMSYQSSVYAQGQTLTVSGTIKDKTGEVIIGATVVVEGTTKGAITDIDGKYSLTDVPSNGTLAFSFIGFKTQKIPIDGKTQINVVLEDESIGIGEVVAIGYGSVKKGDLTGAVAKIDSKSIKERPLTRVDQALAGAMAGVAVRTTSGEPGASLQIRVRGGASITASNDPLYVIDGVVMEDLNGINPNDIQSMEVLKDAASTAIYGSRGSNGVVIVTTNSGKKGKPKFNFSAYYGLQQAEKKLDLLSGAEWEDLATELINKKYEAKGYDASDSYEQRGENLGVTDYEDYENANTSYMLDPRWGTDELSIIDWQDEFYRIAPISNYQLSVSGGTDNTQYTISGAWFDQEGIAIETGYKRMNLNSKLNCQLSKRVKVNLKLSPSYSWKTGPSIEGKDGIAHKMLAMCPVVEKDAGVYTNFGYNKRYHWAGSGTSPIGIMESVTDNTNRMILNSSLGFDINILKGLDFKTTGAWYFQSYDYKNYTPTYDLVNHEAGDSSSAKKDTRRYNNYQVEALLNYNLSINDVHNFTAMAGWSLEDKNYDREYIKLAGFPNDDVTTMNYSSAETISSSYTSETESRYLSYFARVMYNYKSKYLLSASAREDASSKFGSDNYWGFFPAVSVGWKISQENFMQNVSAINNLKVRVSWGVNGNNSVDDYTTAASMGTSNYSFNGTSYVGYYTSSMANTELGWEQTSSTDVGIDVGLLQNRIQFTIDGYYKKTTDLLLDEPLPTVSGFDSSLQNVGSVENEGLELELTAHILDSKLKWSLSGNIGFNKNKVLQLGPDQDYIMSGWKSKTNIIQIGKSLNSFYMYEAIGVLSEADIADDSVAKTDNAEAGDVKYFDYDGNGKINSKDQHIVGKPNPDFTYGITNNFSYKNFNFSFFFQGQQGCKAYALLGRAIDRPGMGVNGNALGRWRNRYRSEAEPGDGHTPRIDGTTSGLLDSRWLYDASYIRLKNITLSYNIPQDLIKGVSNFRVYASLENLWKHDNYYGGFSPESSNSSGTDYGAYPEARSYIFGVNLSF